MAEVSPFSQFPIQFLVQPVKNLFGGTAAIVIGPASDDGVEDANQGRLRATSVLANELLELIQMTFDRRFGRFDNGFEPWSAPVGPGVVFIDWILTDIKAQKVKTHFTFIVVKREVSAHSLQY